MKTTRNISAHDNVEFNHHLTSDINNSIFDQSYLHELSNLKQAMTNLVDRIQQYIPRERFEAITNIFSSDDQVLSYLILKKWIYHKKYSFEHISPVSFSELVTSVKAGVDEYQRKFPELSFIFDPSLDWDPYKAYLCIDRYKGQDLEGNIRGIQTTTNLAKCVTNVDKVHWSVWRMSLKFVTTQAKKHLYKLYEDKGGKLWIPVQRKKVTLTRWIYELARFPAGTINPDLLYKKNYAVPFIRSAWRRAY